MRPVTVQIGICDTSEVCSKKSLRKNNTNVTTKACIFSEDPLGLYGLIEQYVNVCPSTSIEEITLEGLIQSN
jgi:hypothetical protein